MFPNEIKRKTHEEKMTVKLWGCWTRSTPPVFWSSFWIWSRRSLWQKL